MSANVRHAFIFARGGSKGLPGKNIKLLGGKSLLRRAVEVAKACPSLSEVFVSTEDSAIAEEAEACGAVLIRRPMELAGDDSSEWLAWRHAVEWVEGRYGAFDGFVSLPTTSPLRAVEDVEAAITRQVESGADICVAVTPSRRSPYFNMVTFDSDGMARLVNPPATAITRRQDAPEVFDLTTVVYVTDPKFILCHQGVFSGKVAAVVVPKNRAVDIDDLLDFKFAELILNGGIDETKS